MLLAGGLPVVAAWLTKLLLDHFMAGAAVPVLTGLAGGLAVVGLLVGVLPQVTQYVRAEVDRATGLLAQDRLFTAVDGFVGLSRFENPRFLDRLRLAQQAGGMTPNQAVDGVLGVARATLTIAGFLASLLLLSPLMTVLVLAAGLPTLVAEIDLSRRRAAMFWRIGPAERREMFYSGLLSDVAALKEVRLFGIGSFLRDRMLAQRRATNAAKRAMDRREVATQAGLGLLAAVVSGGGLLWAVGSARAGRLSIGDISIFVAAVAGVQAALGTLASEVARTHQALLMFDHFIAVTTAAPDLPRRVPPRPLPTLRHGIELHDVWFRYSAGHPWALRGVDLHIPSGKALALVGPGDGEGVGPGG